MTGPRLAALSLAAVLAACGNDAAAPETLLLSEPSALAAFRGRVVSDDVLPYFAVANAGSGDLTIIDARTDAGVRAPVRFRPLVFPVVGRPVFLASAEFPDGGPDLLVAVAAGGTSLQVLRTWARSGPEGGSVELPGDVLALVTVPSPTGGSVRVAAALSGERIAVVTFSRAGSDGAIDVAGATVRSAGPLGFQPVALAAMAGDASRIWAATLDENGVAQVDVAAVDGTPSFGGTVLDARAPTRLVAAAELRERGAVTSLDPAAIATALDPEGWATVRRVYAVLDESGCGDAAPISCGVVALDADGPGLAPDFVGTSFRAPIAVPGRALALAVSGPPALPPTNDPGHAVYRAPFMRMFPGPADGTLARRTTGAAGVASSDGSLYFVDLGRWEIPGNQAIAATGAVASADPQLAVTGIAVTTGYTPTARWTATYQGELPGLASRRVERIDAAPRLALQARSGAVFTEVARVADAGIAVGDVLVVTDPTPVSTTCAPTFEVAVTALVPEDVTSHPGGAVDVTDPAGCLAGLDGGSPVRATVRAGGWVLVRGAGVAATLAGRPSLGTEHAVVGRRVGYVPELGGEIGDPVARALAFTLELAPGVTGPTRGATVVLDTSDGRSPFRAVEGLGLGVVPRAVVPFDRSRYAPAASDPAQAAALQASGVRFLVPYASGVVLDASPTQAGGGAATMR